jgi:glutathione S-transferase
MSGNPNDVSKPAGSVGADYHRQCTGVALETVKAHSDPVTTDDGLTVFGANFCPFVQRTWIVLEVLGAPYRYYENDPYQKTADLLAINPKGLVPSLKIGLGDKPGDVKGLSESSVM